MTTPEKDFSMELAGSCTPPKEGVLSQQRSQIEHLVEDPYEDLGRSYHLTNPYGIGLGKKAVDGVNYKLGDKTYTLTDDGRVYSDSEERFSFSPVEIKDPVIVDAVRTQRDENEAIRKAREKHAEVLSGGDIRLKEIYRRHLDYTKGHVQPVNRPEGTFFIVGENDWFTFYSGHVDGKKKLYVVGKEQSNEEGMIVDVEEFGYMGDTEELEAYPAPQQERPKNLATRHYHCAGTIWYSSDDNSGEIYRVNREEYVVNGSGAVYQKEDHEVLVTDPAVLLTIKAQVQEDAEIRAAREALATEKSEQDLQLKMVLLAHLEFNSGHISSDEEDGITFYQVGRNASHNFFLGVKDGKMFRRSVGEGNWNEEDNEYTIDSHISEVGPEGVGYVGHY